MAKGIAEATTKIYEQLQGLGPDDRLRAVQAALTMLGEPAGPINQLSPPITEVKDKTPDGVFSEKAKAWIKKNGLETSELEEIFHSEDGKVELILGEAIGKSKREQTVNTYLLTGAAAFLQSGGTDFSEDTARQYCQHLGCYDSPNHSKYLKGFGNKITGSKDSGWKLTAPGLTAAAKLICPVEEDEK